MADEMAPTTLEAWQRSVDGGLSLDIGVQRALWGTTRFYCRYGEPWKETEVHVSGDRVFYIPSGKPWRTHSIDAVPVPRYSTDMAAAWLVVERLRKIGLSICLSDEDDGWEIEVITIEALYGQGYRGCYVTKASAQEAICQAAIHAVSGLR
jgi:hypothetical protein